MTTKKIPVIPLRGTSVLPGLPISFGVSRQMSINAALTAKDTDGLLFVVKQKDPVEETPGLEGLYEYGMVMTVDKVEEGEYARPVYMVKGKPLERARIKEYIFDEQSTYACALIDVVPFKKVEDENIKKRLCEEIDSAIDEYAPKYISFEPFDKEQLMHNPDPHAALNNIFRDFIDDQDVVQQYLDTDDLIDRFEIFMDFLKKRKYSKDMNESINNAVEKEMQESTKKHVLRLKINAIRDELGEGANSEAETYIKKIDELNAGNEVKDALKNEVEKLRSLENVPAESNVLRNYLDTALKLPWDNRTEESEDIVKAREILDRDHYGLKKVKDRMIDFLAVRILTKAKGDSPIICLYGPPGTGKTSIARSVAEALNKNYVRISLGGADDEAEIRGHRKTYVGAMPGRIVKALIDAKSSNPLMLLDEIDKLGKSMQGDPASALLEVMDSEQNYAFRDNFIELPIDLSGVLFIATANDLSTVPRPLLDRMEIIEIEEYTDDEKFHIARNHLVRKALDKCGLEDNQVTFSDSAIKVLISDYTKEAGVRELSRKITECCRKAAGEIVAGKCKNVKLTKNNLEEYIGKKKYRTEKLDKKDDIGIVRGLAWTAVGGTTLKIEAVKLPGKGELKLTGQMGDVMRESAQIAMSYVRSISEEFSVNYEVFETSDFHLHIPEGATPKDGPSAGITMATSLLSAVTMKKVRSDIAMTGEIDLRGNVLPVGGLKSKLLAANNIGVKTVIVPDENKPQIDELSGEVKGDMNIVFAKTMSDVIKEAFVR